MKKKTHYNWWGYINLRVKFLRNCRDNYAEPLNKYKAPNRYLYCLRYRAVIVRYGVIWEKRQPVYVSSFCDTTKCVFKGTCVNCPHNLNNVEK